jgi:hypothetical protein
MKEAVDASANTQLLAAFSLNRFISVSRSLQRGAIDTPHPQDEREQPKDSEKESF